MQVAEALGKCCEAPPRPSPSGPRHVFPQLWGALALTSQLNPLQRSQSELPHPSLHPLPRDNPSPVTVPFGAIQAWNPCPDAGQSSELPVGSAEVSAAAAWKFNFSTSPILPPSLPDRCCSRAYLGGVNLLCADLWMQGKYLPWLFRILWGSTQIPFVLQSPSPDF